MSNALLTGIRGVIFDYGGTLDTAASKPTSNNFAMPTSTPSGPWLHIASLHPKTTFRRYCAKRSSSNYAATPSYYPKTPKNQAYTIALLKHPVTQSKTRPNI